MQILSMTLVILGAGIMLLGILRYLRSLAALKILARKEKLLSDWLYTACLAMMLFFMAGYIVFAIMLALSSGFGSSQLLVAVIFFLGAVFVLSMVIMVDRMLRSANSAGELEKRLAQQELMSEIARDFISNTPTDELLTISLSKVGEFSGVDRMLLSRYEPDGEELVVRYDWIGKNLKNRASRPTTIPFKPGHMFYKQFIMENKPFVAISDLDTNLLPQAKTIDLNALLTMSVMVDGKFWGILEFDRCGQPYNWTESDIHLGSLFTSLISGLVGREAIGKKLTTMSSIVEASPQYIAYMDGRGQFDYINPAASEITGYSAQEIREGGIAMLCGPKVVTYLRDSVIPKLMENGSYSYEIPLVRKDGKTILMSFSNFVIPDEFGVGMGAIAADVTERKKRFSGPYEP